MSTAGETAATADARGPAEAGLAARLHRPVAAVELAGLPRHWRRTMIRAVCHRPADLEEGPLLAERVRGAWGRSLMALAADGGPADAAFTALLHPRGLQVDGRDAVKPYVVRAEARADVVVVQLSLFGFAGRWAREAAAALEQALAGGIDLRQGGRHVVPLPPLAMEAARSEAVAVPDRADLAVLDFGTPVHLHRGRRMAGSADGLAAALARRVAALARWQDLDVTGLDVAVAQAGRLTYRQDALYPVAWTRYSVRQPGRRIEMRGLAGRLVIEGNLAPLLPLLALGETCHAGLHCALGLGQYRLITV